MQYFSGRLKFLKNLLTKYPDTSIMYSDTRKEVLILQKSRAEYFKERRKKLKDFGVLIEREKLEEFEKQLKQKNITKTKWLNDKIDTELKK